MRLSTLTHGLLPAAESPFQGRTDPGSDPEISGICHDSRRVEAGDLFVAWRGARYDGAAFADEAVRRGAAAVLADTAPSPMIPVPWLLSPDPQAALGPLASRIYRHPDRDLTVVGVTGTNGKSTVTILLQSMLEAAGTPTGSVGTLGATFAGKHLPGERTTPEASDLFRTLGWMRDEGARAVVMEVSSHALALGRVSEVTYDLAIFTNLSRDHFDFHSDFEDYFSAKKKLFAQLKAGGQAVVNLDDPYGRRLAEDFPEAWTFGETHTGSAAGDAATLPRVRVEDTELNRQESRGRIVTPRGPYRFTTPLLGRYNIANLLAAAAAAEGLGMPHQAVAQALAAQQPLVGRMEPVRRGQPFLVLIDYAHTHGALEAALRSTRQLGQGHLALVFGCGGERDQGKRLLMGRVAGQGADLPILTNDNPRGEDPRGILAAVEEGLKESGNASYRVIPDRREAIRRAIAIAQPDWAVLVAGKGHEAVQIMGDQEQPFSDREEAERALEERFGSSARG